MTLHNATQYVADFGSSSKVDAQNHVPRRFSDSLRWLPASNYVIIIGGFNIQYRDSLSSNSLLLPSHPSSPFPCSYLDPVISNCCKLFKIRCQVSRSASTDPYSLSSLSLICGIHQFFGTTNTITPSCPQFPTRTPRSQWGKTGLFNEQCWKNGYSHADNELGPLSYITHKNELKMD